MKIVDLKLTDGPNYWSGTRHQLVVMTLDLEDLEDSPTDRIPDFLERLSSLIPSLITHRCSENEYGGFFKRVQRGTWMGHVVEHIALEVQTLAGMNTGFGRTRNAGQKGIYHVVFSYVEAKSGKYAADLAIRICNALITGSTFNLRTEIEILKDIYVNNKLGPSTTAIIDEARKRDIPVLRLNESSYIQLGIGAGQKRIEATTTNRTSNIAVELAADKDATKQILRLNNIPVSPGECVETKLAYDEAVNRIGFPIVVKPVDSNHGNGATINVRDRATASKAYEHAKAYSEKVICEKFIQGKDFRVLVINKKFIAAALRTPASVIADGVKSIRELIDEINKDPRRGDCHQNVLTKILLDDISIELLKQHGFTPESIPAQATTVWLKSTANLSTGGTSSDVTDLVHDDNKILFERIARVIDLDICGIDVVAPELSKPIVENGGVIIEVNAGPGLRMHLQPSEGKARNVAEPIIDMLFPKGNNGRIPIIGITGTNGKTTTTRLIAHMGKSAGYEVGYTTTDGVYIGGQQIIKGDCTGPVSARLVLQDSSVNLAVLECARGGILRAGLGFDRCDIAVITNIAADHIGMNGIDTVEKLAHVKAVLLESVAPQGYAVINADDDQTYNLISQLHCNIALFSMNPSSDRIRTHSRKGGIVAIYSEEGILSIIKNDEILEIGRADEMPITFSGLASFNIQNALSAALASFLQGMELKDISKALKSFSTDADNIPGRMNFFNFGNFKFVVDYAHNSHGLQSTGNFLKSLPASVRIGIIAGVGDRRDEDIISLGAEAAKIFDEIIIRQDLDLRGRNADELNELVCRGIRSVDPGKKINIIPNEAQAIQSLLDRGENGMLATIFADDISAVIKQLRDSQQRLHYMPKQREVA